MSAHSLVSGMFWIATLERAIRSFAASLASLLTAGGTGILDTDWGARFSVAGMAAAVTVLLAIGGGTFGKGDGPSFVGEEKLADPEAADRPARRRRKTARRPAAGAAPAVPAQPVAPAAEQLPEPAPAG
jgi:hypothetical protein